MSGCGFAASQELEVLATVPVDMYGARSRVTNLDESMHVIFLNIQFFFSVGTTGWRVVVSLLQEGDR